MLHRGIGRALVCVLLAGALATACGGDDVTVVQPGAGTGEQGQSCASNSDCVAGLVCFSNICVEEGDQPNVQLGEVGESCASRLDCQQGLQCISNLCTDEPPPDDALGKQGESCERRSDCEAGLTCIHNTCASDDFGLEQTDKACIAVACSDESDCLTIYTPEQCATLQANCTAETPDLMSCDLHILYCVEDNWVCNSLGACAYTGPCTGQASNTCPTSASGSVCDASEDECVTCTEEIGCGANQQCVDNECVTTCVTKEDCPFFHDCDDGECVATGCQTDRECVAYTFNALATCDDDGECIEPCQSDAECDAVYGYEFRACVNGGCQEVGCDTDEECRIRGGSTSTKWSCREAE